MTKIKTTQYQKIHNLYYKDGLNKAQIGRMFGVSRERMRQIINKLSTEELDTDIGKSDTERVRIVLLSHNQ